MCVCVCVCVCVFVVCKWIVDILNKPVLVCLHAVKWFQLLLLTQILLLNINHFFAIIQIVSSIPI